MASESTVVMNCCICDEVFEENLRKPLALDCEHTFCELCLEKNKGRDGYQCCSKCRKPCKKKVCDLPVIFDRVPSSAISSTSGCSLHQKPWSYWCKICLVAACTKCHIRQHNGHDLIDLEELNNKACPESKKYECEVNGKREKLAQLIDLRRERIEIQKMLIEEEENALHVLVSQLKTLTKGLEVIKHEIKTADQKSACIDMLQNIHTKMYGIPDMEPRQDELNSLKEMLDETLALLAKVELEYVSAGMTEIDISSVSFCPPNTKWLVDKKSQISVLHTIAETRHRASYVDVVSTSNEPLPRLVELLYILVKRADNISLQLSDEFIETGGTRNRSQALKEFITDNAEKVEIFLGNLEVGRVFLEEREKLRLASRSTLGVHLDEHSDIRLLVNAPFVFRIVLHFIKGKTKLLDAHLKSFSPIQLHTNIIRFAFHNMINEDDVQVISLLRYFAIEENIVKVWLVKCGLSTAGLLLLVANLPIINKLWVQQIVQLTQENKTQVEQAALVAGIELTWLTE